MTLPGLLDEAKNAPQTPDKGTHGCVLGGTLRTAPGARQGWNIAERTLLWIDLDAGVPDGWTPDRLPWCAVAWETYSSKPEERRYRVVAPFDRPVTVDEWTAVAAAMEARLGALGLHDALDGSSLRWNQYAYRPERAYLVSALQTFDRMGEPVLDVGELVTEGEALEPRTIASSGGGGFPDPFSKPDLIGAFNRAYDDLDELIEVFGLPYESAGRVWKHTDSRSAPGVVELRPGVWFSHHARCDPVGIAGHAVNAFDLVRLHVADLAGVTDHDESMALMAQVARSDKRVREAAIADDFDAVTFTGDGAPASAPAGRNKLALAVRLRMHVEDHFDVFPAEGDGRVYGQAKSGGRAELVSGSGFVIRATKPAGIGRESASLSAAAAEAAKVLEAEAAHATPRVLGRRAHHTPGRIVLDLAQPGNTRCVVVTARGWSVEETPPPDVTFTPAGVPLPTPAERGDLDALRRVLGWDATDDKWLLVKGWLPASLLSGTPRPLLGFFGPQGSAKSTTGRFVVGVLDPRSSGTLGSSFGKNVNDDETKALNSYLVAWDNLSVVSPAASDFLARLVTGEEVEKRRLYTDSDMVKLSYRRTGVVTGINLPSGIKADALDRLVPMVLKPLSGARRTEAELEAAFNAAHPAVLAGVLDLAVRMLATVGENPDGLRMADYAAHLHAIDPQLYAAYARNVRQARSDMAQEDEFIQLVRGWLAWCQIPGEAEGTWEGTSTELLQCLTSHAMSEPNDVWVPKTPRALSQTLNREVALLEAAGIHVEERKGHNNTRLKRLSLVEVNDDA